MSHLHDPYNKMVDKLTALIKEGRSSFMAAAAGKVRDIC